MTMTVTSCFISSSIRSPHRNDLAAAGLGQDADVLLHHGVDVHLDADVVAEQVAQVGAGLGVLLQADGRP